MSKNLYNEAVLTPELAAKLIQNASLFKSIVPFLVVGDGALGFPVTRTVAPPVLKTAAKLGLGTIKYTGIGAAGAISNTYDYLKDVLEDSDASKQKKARAKILLKAIKRNLKKSGKDATALHNKTKKKLFYKDTDKTVRPVVIGSESTNFIQKGVYNRRMHLQKRILTENELKFLIYMCNKNPYIKEDCRFIEACVRNPKKMNILMENTGMVNERALALMRLVKLNEFSVLDSLGSAFSGFGGKLNNISKRQKERQKAMGNDSTMELLGSFNPDPRSTRSLRGYPKYLWYSLYGTPNQKNAASKHLTPGDKLKVSTFLKMRGGLDAMASGAEKVGQMASNAGKKVSGAFGAAKDAVGGALSTVGSKVGSGIRKGLTAVDNGLNYVGDELPGKIAGAASNAYKGMGERMAQGKLPVDVGGIARKVSGRIGRWGKSFGDAIATAGNRFAGADPRLVMAGTVPSFSKFKKNFAETIDAYSHVISPRNLYSLYVLECAANMYGLNKNKFGR